MSDSGPPEYSRGSDSHGLVTLALSRARDAAREATNVDDARALHDEVLAGKWAIVEEFDADGRRHLVVRKPCAPRADAEPHLTLRERQDARYAALGHSGKLIAFEMGLSESTVSGHVNRVMSKLGLRCRIDLVRTLSALSVMSDDPPSSGARAQ
jgi:DNA-binding NarL/FixJ family response regulator